MSLVLTGCNSVTPDNTVSNSIDPAPSEEISVTTPSTTDKPQMKQSYLETINVPSEIELLEGITLESNGMNIPVMKVMVNDSHVFEYPESTRIESGYSIVSLEGKATLTYTFNYDVNNDTVVLPSDYNIVPTVESNKKTVSFEIFDPGYYVIQPNNDIYKAIHLFVEQKVQKTTLDFDDPNLIYFGPGVHNKDNSPYINDKNFISVKSGQTIYLDHGSFVQGRIQGYQVNNVTVTGGGVFDGTPFSREDVIVPVSFSKSHDILVENIYLIDPAAWTLQYNFVWNSSIKNVAIISSRANGDGVTLQSCENITVDNVFARGYDDNLVVKNYAFPYGNTDPNSVGHSNNITFTNCVLWTDLAQSIEIGYETLGEELSYITFDNIIILAANHKPAISIHNGNSALVHDIIFKNITVEFANMGMGDGAYNKELIDFSSIYSAAFSDKAQGPTKVGNIEGVLVENVLVKEVRENLNIEIKLYGQKDTREDFKGIVSTVTDIEFKDITIKNEKLTLGTANINANQYASNYRFSNSDNESTGSLIIYEISKEDLLNYTSEAIVSIFK